MSIVAGSLQLGGGTTAEITAAAAVVPLVRQVIVNRQTGQYYIGDGTTALGSLTAYGVSSSGLTIGTSTITSGTNTNILYNNNGVLGEYTVTGTGTTAVLSTSPVFGGKVEIGAGATGIATSFSSLRVGVNNGLVDVGSIATGYSTIWLGQATPSASNYSILMSGSSALTMQASSSVQMSYAQGTSSFTINATGLVLSSGLSFNGTVASSGSPIPFEFKNPANTNQTTTVNSPSFKVTGSTKQWATGALATQYFNYFSANTVSFVGASTATIAANFVADYVQGGTNATITTNAAIYVPTLALTNTTTGIGLLVESPSGATTNYAIKTTGYVLVGSDTSTNLLRSLVGTTSFVAMYFNQATPSSSNYNITGSATTTSLNGAGGGQVFLRVSNTNVLTVNATNVTLAQQLITPASTTSFASLNIPHGTAPTTPNNGDMWTTTAGLFVRINGVTVGPLS